MVNPHPHSNTHRGGSAWLKPTEARPIVRALFDSRSDVRIAAFAAVSRLPLAPSVWAGVDAYASWALSMSPSVAERLAVIDASPYIPLQSLRDLVAGIAQEGRGEARSHALDAASKFLDPSTFLAAVREGDVDAERLAVAALSWSVGELRLLVQTVPKDSEARFWLAVGLASHGVDEELRAVFEELQQGRDYLYARRYSVTLAALLAYEDSSRRTRTTYSGMRWVVSNSKPRHGRGCPQSLSVTSQMRPPALLPRC